MTDPVQELLDHYRANDPRAPVTRAGGRSASALIADPLMRDLFTTRLTLTLPGPPANLWQGTHLQGKIEIDADVDLRLMHSPAGPDVTVGESMGFELMLAEAMELNLERDLDEIDLHEACAKGDLRAFGNQIVDQLGLQRQWALCHGLEPKIGASWDEHFCLVDALIEGSDVRFELPVAGSATQVEVRIPKGVTLKFGLTPRGWAVMKRRFGGTVTRRIAGAMARVASSSGDMAAATPVSASEAEAALAVGSGMAFASFAGIAPTPAQVALMSGQLTGELARDARLVGLGPGDAGSYGHAYAFTVYFGRPAENAEGSVAAMMRGSRKAEKDVDLYGQTALREALQRMFNRGRPVALLPDGMPASAAQVEQIAGKVGEAIASQLKAR